MAVKFTLDSRAALEGTVLLFGIRYVGADPGDYARTVVEEAKIYTYAMIKAGGYWYVTGGVKTPQVAGWGAVERWLERDGRVVEWVRTVTETAQLWPPVPPQEPDSGEDLSDSDQKRYRDEEPRSESERCPCGLTGFAAPELHRPGCTG